MIYLDLFIAFLKVGLFSFGGAYSSIPLIQDVVSSYGWMNEEMLTYMIGVSESTPGPIMVNMATYVGNSQAGVLGAFVATLAVVLPAFIIILLIMVALKNMLSNTYVQVALEGLKSCIIGIILATGFYMVIHSCIITEGETAFSWKAVLITVVLAVLYYGSRKVGKKGMSPIALILISAVLGVVYGG